jgi:DNA-binding IclR family transcriptional regulator
MGVSELTRELNLNKNMVFRLLQTLEKQGWIIQEEGAKYRASLRPFRHFSQVVDRMDVHQAAKLPLRTLWTETGESCYLAVRDGTRCLFVEHLDSTRPVRVHGQVGGRYRMQCCAPGKVLLAYAPQHCVERVLTKGLEANTDETICDPVRLRQALRQVRRQGYATDLEEFTRGMLCFAAPVFDANMDVVGALGVTVLTLHHSPETLLSELACPVLRAAKAASEILGGDMSRVSELETVEAGK